MPEGIQIEDVGNGIYRLPQFEPFGFQDAYLGRVKDVVILASRKEFLNLAADLDSRSGQDSLAKASNFYDNVTAFLGPDEQPIELFLRWDKIGAQVGRWPQPNSVGMTSKLIGRFFDTQLLRFLSGYFAMDRGLKVRLSGDLDLSAGSVFQQAWLQGPALGANRIKELANMTPADCFAFMTLAGDPSKVLIEGYDLVAGDLRRSLDAAVADSGQYQGMFQLLQEIGQVYKPGLAVILRNNDLPVQESSPKHDHAPVPLIAIIGRVDDPGALDRVQHFLEANWASFTDNRGDETIQRLSDRGGAEGLSFVSTVIPGTGEIVLLHIRALDMLVVTNSADFAYRISDASFTDEKSARARSLLLSQQPSFQSAIDGNANGAHAFLWMDPSKGRGWMEATAVGLAEEAFRIESEVRWRELRPTEEQRLREEMFGERESLSVNEASRLQVAVDEALLAADSGAAKRLPILTESARRDWLPSQLMDWVSLGFRVSRRHAELLLQGAISE